MSVMDPERWKTGVAHLRRGVGQAGVRSGDGAGLAVRERRGTARRGRIAAAIRHRRGVIDRAATERPSTLGLLEGRAIGTQIGVFRIDGLLGVGGMGEVYRARDTKLNRDVAIKILPPAFASDPERLARFKREAQVLASLNHPNIGGIYGFERSRRRPRTRAGTGGRTDARGHHRRLWAWRTVEQQRGRSDSPSPGPKA